jgi:hypothetical protein
MAEDIKGLNESYIIEEHDAECERCRALKLKALVL